MAENSAGPQGDGHFSGINNGMVTPVMNPNSKRTILSKTTVVYSWVFHTTYLFSVMLTHVISLCCQFLINWVIPRGLYTHELLVLNSGAEVLHQFRSFDQFGLPSLWGALLQLGARKITQTNARDPPALWHLATLVIIFMLQWNLRWLYCFLN